MDLNSDSELWNGGIIFAAPVCHYHPKDSAISSSPDRTQTLAKNPMTDFQIYLPLVDVISSLNTTAESKGQAKVQTMHSIRS